MNLISFISPNNSHFLILFLTHPLNTLLLPHFLLIFPCYSHLHLKPTHYLLCLNSILLDRCLLLRFELLHACCLNTFCKTCLGWLAIVLPPIFYPFWQFLKEI